MSRLPLNLGHRLRLRKLEEAVEAATTTDFATPQQQQQEVVEVKSSISQIKKPFCEFFSTKY